MPSEGAFPIERAGLRRDALNFWEVFAQSIANIAPTGTPALVVAVAFASTGNATWLAYIFATVGLLLVTYHINQFARRSASPGSLFTFVAKGLGPTWGVVTGWSLVIAYLFIGGSVLAGVANYVGVLVHYAVQGYDFALSFCAMIVAGLVAWYVAYHDIKLSARFMLVLEAVSVSLILILTFAYFAKTGKLVDRDQLTLSGFNFGGMRQGLVLAIFSFVGFESATALGHEAKNPLSTIPRVVSWTVIATGAFFFFTTYVIVMAFHGHNPPLDQSNAPLTVLSQLAGIPAFGVAIAIGAIVSFFACALASINAGSRVLFAMSRHGLFHDAAGASHKTHASPHVAVTLSSLVVLAVPFAMFLKHVGLLDIYGYLGSLGTFALLLPYVLVAIASPVYLRRRKELTAMPVAVAVLAVGLIAVPLIGNFYPVPAAPYNLVPYIFLILLALGLARFIYLRVREPDVIVAIQNDLLMETTT